MDLSALSCNSKLESNHQNSMWFLSQQHCRKMLGHLQPESHLKTESKVCKRGHPVLPVKIRDVLGWWHFGRGHMESDTVLPESKGSTPAFRDTQSFKCCYPLSAGLEQHMKQSTSVRNHQIWNWGLEITIPLEKYCTFWWWNGGSQAKVKRQYCLIFIWKQRKPCCWGRRKSVVQGTWLCQKNHQPRGSSIKIKN